MNKSVLLALVACVGLSSAAVAALPFHDDFENGMGNWTKWPGAAETLQLTQDKWKSIDPGPWGVHEGHGARQHAYIGGGNGYKSYYDFGVQTGPIRAEVWLFEDYEANPQDHPVFGGLHLIGANNGNVGFDTDYLQLGVITWSGSKTKYSSRTASQGFEVSNVDRKKHWTHLAIEADGVGQAVRFYVDDQLVRTSVQSAPLQYVAIGYNTSNIENFWYDGVRVTPEPASAMLLLIGLGLVARRR